MMHSEDRYLMSLEYKFYSEALSKVNGKTSLLKKRAPLTKVEELRSVAAIDSNNIEFKGF